jgi:hypothetical protein
MKLPPKEKILEAYSAIADKRITLEDQEAHCLSSDRSKSYVIQWDGNTWASSDNATYWQGYPGYPVLAVLLLQGKLTLDVSLIQEMKGIPWKALNARHKRDYAAAAEEAMRDLPHREEILKLARKNNEEIAGMDLIIKRKLPQKKRSA